MTTTTWTTRTAARVMTVLVAVLALVGLSLAIGVAPASSVPNNGGVCAGLDSGKIDVSGSTASVTITAPAGNLIDGYCIKAGSINNDYGPEYRAVSPRVASMTISHSSGKDVSHYSFSWSPVPTTYDYAGVGHAQATACTLVGSGYEYKDFGPFDVTGPTVTKDTPWTDADKSVENAKAQSDADAQLTAEKAKYTIDVTGESCKSVPPPTPDDDLFCVLDEDTWGMKQFFGYEETDVLTWTEFRGEGRALALFRYDSTSRSCETVPVTYGQTHDYCAVGEGSALTKEPATVPSTYPTQYAADQAMVELLTAITAGIIPPFYGTDGADFAGLNWTTGEAVFDAGCVTTPPAAGHPSDAAGHPSDGPAG